MPKELHDKLARQGRAKGLKGERLKAYIFGTMSKIEKQHKSAKKAANKKARKKK